MLFIVDCRSSVIRQPCDSVFDLESLSVLPHRLAILCGRLLSFAAVWVDQFNLAIRQAGPQLIGIGSSILRGALRPSLQHAMIDESFHCADLINLRVIRGSGELRMRNLFPVHHRPSLGSLALANSFAFLFWRSKLAVDHHFISVDSVDLIQFQEQSDLILELGLASVHPLSRLRCVARSRHRSCMPFRQSLVCSILFKPLPQGNTRGWRSALGWPELRIGLRSVVIGNHPAKAAWLLASSHCGMEMIMCVTFWHAACPPINSAC